MAYDFFGSGPSETSNIIQVEGSTVELPDASYIRDAAMIRDGADLVMDGPQGTVVVEGYFSAADTPELTAPGGLVLSPELVESFARSPAQFAQSASLNDESPVGAVNEVSGEATITRLDGTIESIAMGTPVYQGDVIETNADGAVNISFIDETSFAVSEEARLAIDEYVFDPSTEAGTQNFSVLKGVFVFTSGLIGRDDPDDVNIDTPSGSIGIRGTIIAGNVDTGEITVIEGAIVVRDLNGNEMTLATQFETAKMDPTADIKNMGQLSAQEVSDRFVNVSNVSPTLFSSINDAMAEQAPDAVDKPRIEDGPVDGPLDETRENFDADGSVDQNNDSEVDGTIDESTDSKDGAPVGEEMLNEESLEESTLEAPLEPEPTLQTTTTFGTDPLLDSTTTDTTSTDTTRTDTTTTATATTTATNNDGTTLDTTQEPLTSQDNPQNPDTIIASTGGGTGGLSNTAPIHIDSVFGPNQDSIAPNEFFEMSDNQSFSYHFDLEFVDFDAGDTLTYTLTIDIPPVNAGLVSIVLADPNTGLLNVDTMTLAANDSFDFTITATDSAGNSASGSYTLDLIQATNTIPTNIDGVASGVYTDQGVTGDFVTLGGGAPVSGIDIFAGDGNDTVFITDGDSNYVNLGNGQNTINVDGANTNFDNIIVGGFDQDTIRLNNVYNEVWAMDGDDVIRIDLGGGTNALADLTDLTPATNIFIDGGHDNLVAGAAQPMGNGDTLVLEGAGVNLDFRAVDDTYIRGIERLDLTNGAGVNVTLSLQDVLEMTDHDNKLIIRADDDVLNFVPGDFAGFTKTEDVAINDGGGLQNYDLYTNGGGVTLLIQDIGADNNASGAVVNGLP